MAATMSAAGSPSHVEDLRAAVEAGRRVTSFLTLPLLDIAILLHELDRARARTDLLDRAREHAAWIERQEGDRIHTDCEGHALCDFLAWVNTEVAR